VPDSLGAVVVVLVTLVPGFIAATVWARARIHRRAADSDLRIVLQSLVFTGVIQVLLAPLTLALIYPVRAAPLDHPGRLVGWSVIAVLLAPAVIGRLAAFATDALWPPDPLLWSPSGQGWRRPAWGLLRHSSPPSIWDAVAAAGTFDGRFVVIQFKDGHRIAGAFGSGSASITSPEPHGIFLSREWALDEDGELLAEVPGSCGIMVPSLDEVLWIRIQASPEEEP
jgi:hypothetical protein